MGISNKLVRVSNWEDLEGKQFGWQYSEGDFVCISYSHIVNSYSHANPDHLWLY